MTNKTVKQTTSLRRLFLVGILSTGLVPLCATSPYNTASAQSGQAAEQSDIKIVQGCVYETSNGEILPGATISIYQGDKLFTGTV